MRSLRPGILAACLLCAAFAHAEDDCNTEGSGMQPPRPSWMMTWENDSKIGPYGTDQFYTQGFQFGYRMQPEQQTRLLSRITNGICRFVAADSEPAHRKLAGAASIFLGQHFFTPGDITIEELIPDDRPYAAWLYLGTRLELAQKYDEPGRFARTGLFHTFELQVGTVGPRAQGEWVQSHWHVISHAPQPAGWDHQLENEWGVQLRYTLRGLLTDLPAEGDDWNGWQLQGTLDGDFNLGTVLDSASVGTTWRFGRNLGDPVGLGLQPAFKRDGGDANCGKWIDECYLFVGIRGHGVGYNAFMDGSIFHGGHHVEKDPFFGDVTAGVRLGWKRLQLDFTELWRQSEFERAPGDSKTHGRHGFGAVNLRCFVTMNGKTDFMDGLCPGIFMGLLTGLALQNP